MIHRSNDALTHTHTHTYIQMVMTSALTPEKDRKKQYKTEKEDEDDSRGTRNGSIIINNKIKWKTNGYQDKG